MQGTHNFTYLRLSAGTLTESLPGENQFITTCNTHHREETQRGDSKQWFKLRLILLLFFRLLLCFQQRTINL